MILRVRCRANDCGDLAAWRCVARKKATAFTRWQRDATPEGHPVGSGIMARMPKEGRQKDYAVVGGTWRKCWPSCRPAANRYYATDRVKTFQPTPRFIRRYRDAPKGIRGSKRIIFRCRMAETRPTRSQQFTPAARATIRVLVASWRLTTN